MQGPWTPKRKSERIARIGDEIRNAVGAADPQTMWFTMNEVQDGAWGVNGNVVHIEQLVWAFDAERQATIRRFLDEGQPTS